MLYIDYNSAAFGTNIVAAGGVTVQRGELMNPIFQYENPVAQDILGISNHTLGIIAAQNQDATELHFLDAVSKQLVHVKMKITDCNALPQLYFDQLDISLVGTLYFIVQNPNNDINQGFSQIIATDQENTALCGLSVSSILPSTVNAGKGDVVTVQGSGFGISGTVQMKNADDGGLTWVTLDDYDIVSWTDTEIKIKVPSTLPLTTNTNLRKTVGTGPIRITTGGETVETNQVLTVYYAWKNYQINDNNTTIKGNGLHAGRELVYDADMINQHYGYKLIPNVNFTNTDARDVLAKAMNRWTCESNIRWRFADGESTNIANAQDDLSTIRMGTTSTSNILGETQVFIVRCGGGGGSEIGYVRSFDIVISDAHPFFYDATGLEDTPAGFNDYYSMILHELGHAHLLEHIIDPHDLMYWSLMPNNIEVSSEDRKIDFSQSNIDAAHAIMDESVQTSFGFCTTQDEAHESLVLSDCESANSLTENHFGLPHNLKIIPNPAMDKVDVHFYLKSNHNISLSIHSVQGRLMIRSESIKGQTGDNKVSFDISDLKKGIYFIVLQTQGHGFTSKLVVL